MKSSPSAEVLLLSVFVGNEPPAASDRRGLAINNLSGLNESWCYLLLTPAAEDGKEQAGEPDADDPPRPGRVGEPRLESFLKA